jgi:hypothetical protein
MIPRPSQIQRQLGKGIETRDLAHGLPRFTCVDHVGLTLRSQPFLRLPARLEATALRKVVGGGGDPLMTPGRIAPQLPLRRFDPEKRACRLHGRSMF